MNVIKILKEKLKKNDILRYKYLKLKEIYMRHKFNTLEKKEDYIKKKFKKCLGYEIDFNKEPETFNQKIQFRKLYDKNPLFSLCADKYRVREYVKEKIGEEYLVPLYLVTDHLTEEQWDSLPNSFVIKTNHDSGTVKIIKDKSKVDKNKIIKIMNEALKIDYGIISMEQYYSDIPRKIIAEKYLGDNIQDYKFHIFKNGEFYLQIDSDRFIKHKRSIFNKKFEKTDFKWNSDYEFIDNKKILNKNELLKMSKIAQKMGEEFEYVRIDLFWINSKIYIGEMTFCAASGFENFSPQRYDKLLGDLWSDERIIK